MRHLFSSRVEALRLSGTLVDGTPTLTWAKVADVLDPFLGVAGEFMCRIDLSFLRPGKDAPMPATAGRAPDQIGLLFLSNTDKLKAGDRIHTLAGPIVGTYEIRLVPDGAPDYGTQHHLEVQIVEVAQGLSGSYPSAEPLP